ncbi:hypothetical protein VTL71DRAFT_11190 [Oculimacula yallundae]|uniref:Uncharacterized protein n=1 Tax=Oculimacula yallundae TaxID=86028 RepID=A0ABR4CXS4_9HELO
MSSAIVPTPGLNTTSSTPVTAPADNTVSWQSIFFGLAALALNSMTQRSYFDESLPANSMIFAMRSSPFVCIADLIEAFVVIILYFVQKRSVNVSSSDDTAIEGDATRLGAFAEVIGSKKSRGRPWVMLVLFVGTSTQAVKILGSKCLIWTKIWTVSYVTSYIALALIEVSPARVTDQIAMIGKYRIRLEAMRTFRTTLHVTAMIIHALCFFWTSYQLVHLDISMLFEYSAFLSLWALLIRLPAMIETVIVAMTIFSPLWLLIIPIFMLVIRIYQVMTRLESDRQHNQSRRLLRHLALTACIWLCRIVIFLCYVISFGILMFSVIVYRKFRMHVAEIFVQGLSNTLIAGFPCLVFFHYLISKRVELPKAEDLLYVDCEDSWNKARLVTFAFMNFVIGLLYYCVRYNPQGTVKPAWTERLG